MQLKQRKTFVIFSLSLLILINFFFFLIGYYTFLNPELGKFEVKVLKEAENTLQVEVTPAHNATEYSVSVFKANTKIYETSSPNYRISLDDFTAEFNDTLDIQVIAKNKNGEEKQSENKFIYLYKDSTFEKERDHYLSGTRDLTLFVKGYDDTRKYTIELYYGDLLLYNQPIESENVVIPYHIVDGYSGRITALLKNEYGRVTSSFNFYLNTPVVGKIHILNPANGYKDRWNDVLLTVEGGKNANHYYVSLSREGILEKRVEVKRTENQIWIPAETFEEEKEYLLTIQAVYDDFLEIAEESSIVLTIEKKETTSGVYTSHNPTFIKKGTPVELKTRTKDAVIYYTLDGSDPTEESLVYQKPLIINEDVTLKTYAKSKNRFDSVIRTYSFSIRDKTPVIYLSPSNQSENYGVYSTGFTTEMEMMNRIADVVGQELKNAGFIVYRNSPHLGIDEWVVESKRLGADFHFAIHSNASRNQTARGPEIHVDNEYSLSYSIAAYIYENLWDIYPSNDNQEYNRGIKYARGNLGEASDRYLECSSLLEVAFHDEENDARFIVEHLEEIGKNIATSIISYYN